MENKNIVNTYELYRDIKERCGGEIYIGVLGPVRTGKSTFIKRFMNEMVLPYMEDEHAKMRAQDELPKVPEERQLQLLNQNLSRKKRLK